MSVVVRDRADADLGPLVTLALQVHELDGYPGLVPTDWQAFLASRDALGAWVAESEDGEIIGHVALHRRSLPVVMERARERLGGAVDDDDGLAVVARLLVDPTLRRAGVGRMLLEHAAAAARGLGRHPILDVVTRYAPAVALYEACGWANAGEVELVFASGQSLRSFVFVAPPWRAAGGPT